MTKITDLEALKAARELLSDPDKWIQGDYYKNKDGDSAVRLKDAVCFCSLGALRKVSGQEHDCNLPGRNLLNTAVTLLSDEI